MRLYKMPYEWSIDREQKTLRKKMEKKTGGKKAPLTF